MPDYEELKREHIADYQALYHRMKLKLTDEKTYPDIPTDQRLLRFWKDRQEQAMVVLMCNFGRYLAIAASRPGSQPMNLQGIWNDKLKPPWRSNYTVNINTQMNYWPINMCRMSELALPLIEMIRDLSLSGERTAAEHYGAKGWTAHHNVDIWRMASPAPGLAKWSFWQGGSGWLCRHLFEYFEYTQDFKFLEDTAHPIIKKAAEFYMDTMVERDGNLFFCPATSPENEFVQGKKKSSVAAYSTMSQSIIRDTLVMCIQTHRELQIEDQFLDDLQRTLQKMQKIAVGSKGQILEWDKEYKECDIHHRHCSHLYGLHPAGFITPEKTPELAQAAQRTLKIRGDNGTGWSLAWKINFWARLQDGNHALKLIENQLYPVKRTLFTYLGKGGTYPNLFDAHPPFQIDGNFGFVSGVIEMLMQSRDGCIYLLPALPDQWRKGSVKRLLAKGNIIVDFAWDNGRVTRYCLRGNGAVSVIYNGQHKQLFLNGTELHITVDK